MLLNNRNLCENCFSEISAEPCLYCGFDRSSYRHDPMTLPIGVSLNNRYQVGGVIGKGGFGITYLGYDLRLNTRIAIKEYYPVGLVVRTPGDPLVSVSNQKSETPFKEGAEKFYNEASMVAQFNGNPNIVSVYDFFYENNTVYYIMGFLQGQTLNSYIEKQPINEGQAVKVIRDISNALATAHGMSILHRDISPDNIMLCDDGSIKLIDFGAARQVVSNQGQGLSIILKQGFAPLEQYQKKGVQGPWTDIYALGATVYNALTGDIPDDPMSRLGDDSDFQNNKYGISEGLWRIIQKATMLNTEDRYQSIKDLHADLIRLDIEPEGFITTEIYNHPNNNIAKSFDNRVEDQNATTLLPNDDIRFENNTIALSSTDAFSATDATPAVSSKDKLYQKGETLLNSNNEKNIEEAIILLKSLGDYKESRHLLSKAKIKLRTMREKSRKKRFFTRFLIFASVLIITATCAIIIYCKYLFSSDNNKDNQNPEDQSAELGNDQGNNDAHNDADSEIQEKNTESSIQR